MPNARHKCPCHICWFDAYAKDKHFCNHQWPLRDEKRNANDMNPPLADVENIIVPPLHCKLGVYTQFSNTLPKLGRF